MSKLVELQAEVKAYLAYVERGVFCETCSTKLILLYDSSLTTHRGLQDNIAYVHVISVGCPVCEDNKSRVFSKLVACGKLSDLVVMLAE